MSYYVFSGTTGTGMDYRTIKALELPPPKIGNWVFQREIRINSLRSTLGASSAEIVEAVKRMDISSGPSKPTEKRGRLIAQAPKREAPRVIGARQVAKIGAGEIEDTKREKNPHAVALGPNGRPRSSRGSL